MSEKRINFQRLPSSDLYQDKQTENPAKVIGAFLSHLPFFIFILELLQLPEKGQEEGY